MYSKELMEIMKETLDSWEVEYTSEKDHFIFEAQIDGKINLVEYRITVNENGYIISAILEDVSVEEKMLTDVLEYINMVNNHESQASMNVYDDFIMCSIYLNYRGMIPNKELLKTAMLDICECIENFGGGILDVLEKKGTPIEIFENCLEEITDEE